MKLTGIIASAMLTASYAFAILGPPASQVSFPTNGSYNVIDPATADVEQALLDLDGGYTNNIAALEAEVDANTAGVATNTADIATNTADIATNTADIAALEANDALNLSGRAYTGFITGLDVGYSDSNTVTVSAGKLYVTDTWFTQASATTHDLTGLAAGADFHYIYVDYSASTSSVPVFIDGTTEPAFSDSLGGWYSGSDRCIGAVYSESGGATIAPFVGGGDSCIYTNHISMASNMNPDGTLQIPDDDEGDGVTPVMATWALVTAVSSESTDDQSPYVGVWTKEAEDLGIGYYGTYEKSPLVAQGATWEPTVLHPERARLSAWIRLGSSRKLRVGADDNDDNASLNLWIQGWRISR